MLLLNCNSAKVTQMQRAEKHRIRDAKNTPERTLDRMSKQELDLLNRYIKEKAEQMSTQILVDLSNVINVCFLKAMRDQKISIVRAHAILDLTDVYINEQSLKALKISKNIKK